MAVEGTLFWLIDIAARVLTSIFQWPGV